LASASITNLLVTTFDTSVVMVKTATITANTVFIAAIQERKRRQCRVDIIANNYLAIHLISVPWNTH
jgi:hypothetical protein